MINIIKLNILMNKNILNSLLKLYDHFENLKAFYVI